MENVLVLGSGGMLGYAVQEYFYRAGYNTIGITRNDFDAVKTDVTVLSGQIANADLVINCIGIIKQVIDNYTPYEIIKTNSILPRNLAKLCKANDTPLIQITTDCVYSGRRGSYSEKDLIDAEDLYGLSKAAGETEECMSLRTSIIGPEKTTHRSLLGWALSQKGKEVNGFTNHKWNGVTTLHFAQIAESIILDDIYKEGLFHLYSPDSMSKYEILCMFNEIFSLGMTVRPFEAPENCDRRLSSIYPLSKKISTLNIKEQVKELKEFFNL
jgi:dTDP-4-dehydrorhamnose reductase